jgi:hypothetical protein
LHRSPFEIETSRIHARVLPVARLHANLIAPSHY